MEQFLRQELGSLQSGNELPNVKRAEGRDSNESFMALVLLVVASCGFSL